MKVHTFYEHHSNKQDQWEDEDLARVLSLSASESHQSSATIQNKSQVHNHSQNQMSMPLVTDEEDIQLAKTLSLSMLQEHFSCPICENKFNKKTDLDEHVQLHFDN
jgi:hypothetical protein